MVGRRGVRSVERLSQVDRKTVRRCVVAAEQLGLQGDGGEAPPERSVGGDVRGSGPAHRSDGHGAPWRLLAVHHDKIAGWVADDLTGVKIHELLDRQGIRVPLRTVQLLLLEVCGGSRVVVRPCIR